ncbi:hypothetical protein TI39_contig5877g00001 [Zymoseptoria brevis]|uniref:Zn(2)-C6 fungal-type domain-containing protein n=1 Tax=Zymoseptoria brevis TaxID=1047168 RepID=A0A0F4G4Q6_9PEZI|nr:hypothetical protein TI39_contig5877g00001 [Zymoseptoria brevis]
MASREDPSTNPAAFLAPSDFLPDLPPSTLTPSIARSEALEDGAGISDSAPSKPLADTQGRQPNPRSCVTCRKRKVKCDKLHPCRNCGRAHIECVFPAPGRAPRKSRKVEGGRDKELLARLRRLEGVVKGLGVEVPEKEHAENESARAFNGLARSGSSGETDKTVANGTPQTTQEKEEEFAAKSRWLEDQQKGRFENRFGRLVVNEGRSRYINNSFWANLSNEVEDLKGILNQSSDEDDTPSPGVQTKAHSSQQGFVFGFSSQSVDLLSLHPPPAQIGSYWETYKDRVDPILKLIHIPTLEPTILSAANHLPNLSKGFECLLFAVYYGATTSLSGRECLLKLGEEKSVLLSRYRFAVEQALARAGFLNTEELVVLQAFVIFLMCLRRNSDARVIWTLSGLVVRISQTLGIHRDGTHFGLAPFEVEMRRRLWWQVCILDVRASEDHGCDPTIIESAFDAKLPTNCNDTDLTPSMKEFPTQRKGCTDMSFSLLRFEVSNTFRRLNYIPPGPTKACEAHLQSVTLEDKERWITECHQRLEETYLKHCDMTVPLYWVTATVARLMMSKMWLMVYHPFQRRDGGTSLDEITKTKLFITSLENMEYSLLLETEPRTRKWSWLFRTYVQWHALAFTLSELCHRTAGPMVERAWAAVENTRNASWGENAAENLNTGHLWRPLKKLYRKAQNARREAMLLETAQAPGMAATRTYTPNANPMFEHANKPTMTRAPLSAAQLKRFSSGPTFGQAPLDKHELLRSPKESNVELEDLMDVTSLSANMLQESADMRDIHNASAKFPLTPAGGQPTKASYGDPSTAYGSTGLSFDDLSQASGTGQGSIPTSDVQAGSAMNFDNDFSIMDTSGDLNWENWDQLVRQFGTEVESTLIPPPGAITAGQYWMGPQWQTGAVEEDSLGNGFEGGGAWL